MRRAVMDGAAIIALQLVPKKQRRRSAIAHMWEIPRYHRMAVGRR